MAVKFSSWGNHQFLIPTTGAPASGYKLYTYVAGSSTLVTTYTTFAGSVAQSNPIVLNSAGFPTTGQIWITEGSSVKIVFTDASDVVIKTEDNIPGVNDTTVTQDEWVSGPTPTFDSTTSFTLVGDQTSTFHVGRRVKTTNSGGTIYSRISVTAFTTLTTVTVVNDSGVLDSGLSAVSYGLISAVNPSVYDLLAVHLAGSELITGVKNSETGVNYLAGSGTDTYTATLSPVLTTYTTGAEYNIKIANANTSTTPTLNLNSLGAKTIVKEGSVALIPGDMPANHEAKFRYNGTNMVLLNPKWTSGSVIQIVNTQTGATANGTTVIPNDDTIPQNSEGDERMTLAITPKSSTSKLKIDVVFVGASSGTVDNKCVALFQDSTADALAAVRGNNSNANLTETISFSHYMTSGTTSATTFKVRAGGIANTLTFNGAASARLLGGVCASSITITEIAP